MIFDIPASIGGKREYLVLNGVDIEPFTFPTLQKIDSFNSTNNPFKVVRSEGSNVITLTYPNNGEYYSDRDKHYVGIGQFNIKQHLANIGENIQDFSKLCFVVSFKNYDSDWYSQNSYHIASLSNIPSSTLFNQYDVETKTLQRVDDGDKSIYKFDIKSFYNSDYVYIRFYRSTAVVPLIDEETCLYIHSIYLE